MSGDFEFADDPSGSRVLRHMPTGGVYAVQIDSDPEWWLSTRSGIKASVVAWPNPDKLGQLMRVASDIAEFEEG